MKRSTVESLLEELDRYAEPDERLDKRSIAISRPNFRWVFGGKIKNLFAFLGFLFSNIQGVSKLVKIFPMRRFFEHLLRIFFLQRKHVYLGIFEGI
jgi:hypothetical protein